MVTKVKFEREVTIVVAWPEIDDLKVYQVTAISPDGVMYPLHILSAIRPVKLKRK